MPPSELARWFSENVQPHEPALRAYLARRFPSLPDHDDLVQETYARLLRLKDRGALVHPKAFLFTAARNAAIDLFRRRKSQAHDPLDGMHEVSLLEEAPGVREAIERRQRLDTLTAVLDGLPQRCREVMLLRHLDGYAVKEIADCLGISVSTVKEHLAKGMLACARQFEGERLLDGGGATSEGGA